MRAKKTFAALSAACFSLVVATSVVAQDDLNDLLDLDAKPAAKKAAPAPAEEKPATDVKEAEKPAEAAKPAIEKPAEEEAKPAVAESKPVEEPAAEKPAEEKAKPAVAESKPAEEPAAEKPAEEEAKPAVAESKPAEEPAAEKPAEEESKPAVAETKPVGASVSLDDLMVTPAAKPAEEDKPAVAETKPTVAEVKPVEEPAHPEAALISDLVATETLRRQALDAQASKELGVARAAMEARDWETAYKQYRLADAHMNDREDSVQLRRECRQGMAEAKYRAAKQALKEGDRERAKVLAEEALAERHPLAGSFLESLKAESVQEAETDIADIKHRRNDADYKMDRDVVRKRIRLSAQYLAVADLANALDQVDLVLRNDPYNEEAIALRDRIQRKRDLIIDKEREATRKGMIADVGAAWRPVYAVNSADLKSVSSGTSKSPLGGDGERSMEQTIEKRMKEMMLPSISFRPPATIIDAVDYFRQASKDYDRPEIPVDQRGFNFICQLDKVLTSGGAGAEANDDGKNSNAFSSSDDEGGEAAGDVPVIPNVTASNVSLWEALKLVCQVCKPAYKFKVQGSVIMVMPKTMTTDELVTRTYSVVESFVDRMNDASNSLKDQKAGDFSGGGDGGEGGGSDEDQWKAYFADLGVNWPQNSKIKYIKAVGKLRVTNTEDQLAILEDALNELNVTPSMIEIETRFVEVAQEDLNSLGFEWLLNSDYSFNVGGKLAKALNLKDGAFNATESTTTERVPGIVDGVASVTDVSRTTKGTVWGRNWHQAGDTMKDSFGNDVVDSWLLPDGTTSKSWAEGATPQTYKKYSSSGYNKTGKNVGINAIDGSTYQTGMRYLSTEGNHISGEGASQNDKFMRVNAFLGNADLSMILHMLSQRSDTDLLSAPKVVTKSGNEAVIKVVTIYRYPQDYDVTIQSTSSGSSSTISGTSTGGSDGKILPMVEPQNFEQQEVGVILTVTPELSPEGLINLALEPKVISEPTWKDYGMKVPMSAVMSSTAQTLALASGEEDMNWFTVPMEQPFFKERSINTHVTLYNGSTIVMGGLITEERKSMEDKIPFLGDIPFVGRLFRSRSEWSNKRNLLIFVSARLVDPNGRQIIQNQDSDTTAADKEAKATPAPADK